MKFTIVGVAAVFMSFGTAAAENAKAGAKLYGNPGDGRVVVERWCVGCHSMGVIADDRFPSFPMLAKDMTRSEGAIRAFLMLPHKPMPPLELSSQQIEDIVAFLRTVQPGTALK